MRINIYLSIARLTPLIGIILILLFFYFLVFFGQEPLKRYPPNSKQTGSTKTDDIEWTYGQPITAKVCTQEVKPTDLIRQQKNVTSLETTGIPKRTNVFTRDGKCLYIDLGIREVGRRLKNIDFYDGKRFQLNQSQIIDCTIDKEVCPKSGWRLITMSDNRNYCINKNSIHKIGACKEDP